MAVHTRAAAAALFSAGVAAAVLAIIAGLYGMHVVAGGHATHGSQPEWGPAQVALATAVHASDSHTTAVHAGEGTSSCGGSCQDIRESGAPCVPSAKTGSLKVFPPHETGIVFPGATGACPDPAAAYSHLPPSPTLCEMSISRT